MADSDTKECDITSLYRTFAAIRRAIDSVSLNIEVSLYKQHRAFKSKLPGLLRHSFDRILIGGQRK